MKNLKQIVTTVGFILLMMYPNLDCAQLTSNKNKEFKTKIVLDYLLIAQNHSKGLDYIYKQVSKLGKTKIQNLDKKIESLTWQYIENQSQGRYAHKEFIKNDLKFLSIQDLNNSKTEQKFNFKGIKDKFLLKIVNDVKSVLLNNSLTLDKKLQTIESKIKVVEKINESDEKKIVLTGLYIGKNSLNYWMNNGIKWETLFNKQTRFSFNWGSVAWSDAFGAIGMASELFISGTAQGMIAASGPAGAVGVGMVIAAGAIMGSATDAAYQLAYQ